MATYPVVNQQTGEQKEVVMSVHDWDQWKEDNPDWQRYFTPENSPSLGIEVGEWRDKLVNKNPGWGEVLKKTAKALEKPFSYNNLSHAAKRFFSLRDAKD